MEIKRSHKSGGKVGWTPASVAMKCFLKARIARSAKLDLWLPEAEIVHQFVDYQRGLGAVGRSRYQW